MTKAVGTYVVGVEGVWLDNLVCPYCGFREARHDTRPPRPRALPEVGVRENILQNSRGIPASTTNFGAGIPTPTRPACSMAKRT